MIRCVVFDFDGTLVLSNDIKHDGFLAIAGEFDDGAERMGEILASPPGDREAIMQEFARRVTAAVSAEALVQRYTEWCEARIVGCPARKGADTALQRLRRAGLRIHVNSATPTAPLRAVVERRYADGTFDGVHGGHGAKLANLRAIQQAEAMAPEQIAMVGDGVDDRDAASAFGCAFVGVTDGTLQRVDGATGLLDDLAGLAERLDLLGQTSKVMS